jgi:protein KRI1
MSKEKKTLFEDDADGAHCEKDQGQELAINKKFADKFDFNNKRIEKERLTQKYGNNFEDEESYYDSETEDEDGVLLNPRVEAKYNNLLHRIQTND